MIFLHVAVIFTASEPGKYFKLKRVYLASWFTTVIENVHCKWHPLTV